MRSVLALYLFVFAVLAACGGASRPNVTDDPSTLAAYPCHDPHLQWCDAKHLACCDADDEVCCTGATCPAGMCETVASVWGKKDVRRRPQTHAQ